jgi:hypothetical protein
VGGGVDASLRSLSSGLLLSWAERGLADGGVAGEGSSFGLVGRRERR